MILKIFELFAGLGRFDSNRGELYNFEKGGPNTRDRFTTISRI